MSDGDAVCGGVQCAILQFCGTDNQCHEHTCEEFYLHGPRNMTAYNPERPVPLTCEDFVADPAEQLHAVVRGCNSVPPQSAANETLEATLPFNVRCSSIPTFGATFTCYKVSTETNFTNYLDAAAMLEDFCVAGETPFPRLNYLYQISTVSLDYGEGQMAVVGNASRNFQESLAYRSFYAIKTYDAKPTVSPFPTIAPTTLAPSSGPPVADAADAADDLETTMSAPSSPSSPTSMDTPTSAATAAVPGVPDIVTTTLCILLGLWHLTFSSFS